MINITIELNKVYFVSIDNFVPVKITSMGELFSLLQEYEFDSLTITFQTYLSGDKELGKQTFVNRVKKIAKTLDLNYTINNEVVDGNTFPSNYIVKLN